MSEWTKKDRKLWLDKELRPAYKQLKWALKSGDEEAMDRTAKWMIATCEVMKRPLPPQKPEGE